MPPRSSRRNKREASPQPEQVVIEEQPEKKKAKRNSRNSASLNEDDLSGRSSADVVAKLQADRVFWSQFDTRLLYAWCVDYKDIEIDMDDAGNRELILDT